MQVVPYVVALPAAHAIADVEEMAGSPTGLLAVATSDVDEVDTELKDVMAQLDVTKTRHRKSVVPEDEALVLYEVPANTLTNEYLVDPGWRFEAPEGKTFPQGVYDDYLDVMQGWVTGYWL